METIDTYLLRSRIAVLQQVTVPWTANLDPWHNQTFDTFVGYDAQRSAESGLPHYCLLGRCSTADFEKIVHNHPKDNLLTFHRNDYSYVILRETLPGGIEFDALQHIEQNGTDLVLIESTKPRGTYFAQDLRSPVPSFVLITKVEHEEGWELVAAHSAHAAHHLHLRQYINMGEYSILVSDFIPGISLAKDLEENFQIYLHTPSIGLKILLDIIDTVNDLHDLGVHHCNLHPENIRLSKDDRSEFYIVNLASNGAHLSERKDFWGISLLAILLSHPYLIRLWSLDFHDPANTILDTLDAFYDTACQLDLPFGAGLPISDTLRSILLRALAHNPDDRPSRWRVWLELELLGVRKYIKTYQEIRRSRYEGTTLPWDVAVLMKIVPAPPLAEPGLGHELTGHSADHSHYGGLSVRIKEIWHTHPHLPRTAMIYDSLRNIYLWSHSAGHVSENPGERDSEYTSPLDNLARAVVETGSKLVPKRHPRSVVKKDVGIWGWLLGWVDLVHHLS